MCDYSLHTAQNRLAEEGEELVLYKFETGTLGFASLSELMELETSTPARTGGFWSVFKDCILGRHPSRLRAICIPPGAQLLLIHVPRSVQMSFDIGVSSVVVFTELPGRSYSYRDAILLPNGTRVLLQDLPEGLHALVLSISPEPSAKSANENEEVYAA
jgi:hypothetical protein